MKTEHELAGIRRACRAVEAGMAVGLELLKSAERSNGVLTLGGEPLTCERVKLEVERAFGEHGSAAEEFIVSHGTQTAVGHDGGSGPIAADDVVLFDLFPRDRESACYSDFTRTVSHRPRLRRAARVPPAREGGARHGGRGRQAGREGKRHPPPGLRLLPRARPQDAAAQGGGRGARRRLLPRDRSRRRPRGPRTPRCRQDRERASRRRRRDRARARSLPARLRAASGSRTSCS